MKVFLALVALLGCTSALNDRIVGGKEVNVEDYPHQVSLQYIEDHICGASVISKNFVITAAHCTNEKVAKFMYIRAGTSEKDQGGVDVKLKNVFQHPQYVPATYDYDITILELATPLEFSTKIKAIGLPVGSSQLPVGTVCTVTGWGYDKEGGHFMDHLRGVNLPIILHETCEKYYKKMNEDITERMICAGYANGGQDACQGDSGGPLISDGKLIGVVSWGEGCAQPEQPGVFANVAYFRDFIKKTTGL